jgi:dGTPase
MNGVFDFMQFKNALNHLALDSSKSLGRRFNSDEELLLYGDSYDPFQLDIEKIRLGKFYRRLFNKTQVFPLEIYANIRNRQVHTNEVVSIASFVASVLGLNQKLAEAIAYGHDIGHTPFGHLGERVLSQVYGRNFSHAIMGVVIAQSIERKGKGLNLCYETLEGMLNHSRGGKSMSASNGVSSEAHLVMISDKIAYTFSDLNDALRLGFLRSDDLPKNLVYFFGQNQRERVAKTLFFFIKESVEVGHVSFLTSPAASYFFQLREWMYKNVYHRLDVDIERKNKEEVIKKAIDLFATDKDFQDIDPFLATAILTDDEALSFDKKSKAALIKKQGFFEILISLNGCGHQIDVFNPDLEKGNFKF